MNRIGSVPIVAFTIFSLSFAMPVSVFAESMSAEQKYDSSYTVALPDSSKPLTVELQYHLYNPGDEVKVEGALWADVVNRIDVDVVKIQVKDNRGNMIEDTEANLNTEGKYATTFTLVDGAQAGTYTLESKIEVGADILGILQALTSVALNSSVELVVANPEEHEVEAEDQDFEVLIASNSNVDNFKFRQGDKRIEFFVEGNEGTTGVSEVTIPKELLSGEMTVLIDQNIAAEEDVIVKSETDAEMTLEINYMHSIHRVEIAGTSVVPEFPVAVLVMAGAIGSIIVLAARGNLLMHKV